MPGHAHKWFPLWYTTIVEDICLQFTHPWENSREVASQHALFVKELPIKWHVTQHNLKGIGCFICIAFLKANDLIAYSCVQIRVKGRCNQAEQVYLYNFWSKPQRIIGTSWPIIGSMMCVCVFGRKTIAVLIPEHTGCKTLKTEKRRGGIDCC